MSDKVGFFLDGQEVLTYDRSQDLPDNHRQYLAAMDAKMDSGFVLGDQTIENPNGQQKTQFVAMNLINALLSEDDQTAIMMFSYLVNRMPELKQAKAKAKEKNGQSGHQIGVEFIFDEVKSEGQKIEFHPINKVH